MPDFLEKQRCAEAKGWKVVRKERYNPGGSYYELVLVDPDGNERGTLEKYNATHYKGREEGMTVPDADAEAWTLVGC